MNNVNQTLYIPLYGKALVSRKGMILSDPRAEAIWASEGFPLKGKSASKWLAYYMGMRSAVFDRWLTEQMKASPDSTILHLGCGMDSRAERVGVGYSKWFDVDFPAVIAERRRYYSETDHYKMYPADLRTENWYADLPKTKAIIVMEGVSMYLTRQELTRLLTQLTHHFEAVTLLMDCYTEFAAKASKYKNPINDVGVTTVYGLDDPISLTGSTGLSFVRSHSMTPEDLIAQLPKLEQGIFRALYAGSIAEKTYRLYEYSA